MGDDDIIETYERELGAESSAGDLAGTEGRKPSNRGFWIVVGTIVLASVVLVVEIFANRPIANTIGHAQHDLRVAQGVAEAIWSETGSFAGADATGMNERGLGDGLTAVGPVQESSGLQEVSVVARDGVWGAAVTANPGACFYLKLVAGAEEPLYGVGETCTGREALEASDTRW
jgi:hypothetical protein